MELTKREIRFAIVDQQDGKCRLCGHPIKFEPSKRSLFARSHSEAGFVPIVGGKPRTLENIAAVCNKCVGQWDGKMSLDELAIYVRTPKPEKPKKELVENPETLPRIREELAKLTSRELYIPDNFKFAPPDRAEQIAQTIFFKYGDARYGHVGKKVGKELRRRLLAEQNYRCCYDGHVMKLEGRGNDHRIATIEHVEDRGNGGTHDYWNMVMACRICNNVRSHLGLTAVEFYEFLQKNPGYIESKIADIETGKSRMLRKQKKNAKRAAKRAEKKSSTLLQATGNQPAGSGGTEQATG